MLFLVTCDEGEEEYYIIASSYAEAAEKWKQVICRDNDGVLSLDDPTLVPLTISFVVSHRQVIL
jgi:hypothetical protein